MYFYLSFFMQFHHWILVFSLQLVTSCSRPHHFFFLIPLGWPQSCHMARADLPHFSPSIVDWPIRKKNEEWVYDTVYFKKSEIHWISHFMFVSQAFHYAFSLYIYSFHLFSSYTSIHQKPNCSNHQVFWDQRFEFWTSSSQMYFSFFL